ncbi:hypothetical protein KQX54_009690 [Cotesia glomerata]|uniref:Uncharacterized protein n=1 Tax=Cotesia glomerata TaxID=32391 RepID=A0AAV7IRE7_COTGL|nr:hypothetical protein KQX54_009690 [Cotesia glomerata]
MHPAKVNKFPLRYGSMGPHSSSLPIQCLSLCVVIAPLMLALTTPQTMDDYHQLSVPSVLLGDSPAACWEAPIS